MDNDISVEEYQALAEFRYQIRHFLHFSEQAARAAGIEPQQHQLLLALKGLPEGRQATVGELAERMQLQHHSTVELINRLVERGFVQRCRDEEDLRRVLVSITARGEEILRELSFEHRAELRSNGPALAKVLQALLPSKKGEERSPFTGGITRETEDRA